MTKVVITFRRNGANGGPYISHKRIMSSSLKESYEFVPFYYDRIRDMLNPMKMYENVKKLKEINPSIVHITGLQLEGFVLALLCKLAGFRSVLAVHGSSLEIKDLPLLRRVYYKLLEGWTLKNTDYSFGVSDYVGNLDIVKKYSKKYYGTIYNIPEFDHDSKEQKVLSKTDFGFKEDDLIIVSTGRIIKDKGYDTLADVILKGTWDDNVKFLIVGDGNYCEEMKRTLDSCMAGRVLFTGYRSDVKEILDLSDIFILCTRHETLSISILEASQMGLPCVASNVGGIPEIIENGVEGFLCDYENPDEFVIALQNLVNSEELRQKLGENSKKKIKFKFDKNRIVEDLDTLYKTIYIDKR